MVYPKTDWPGDDNQMWVLWGDTEDNIHRMWIHTVGVGGMRSTNLRRRVNKCISMNLLYNLRQCDYGNGHKLLILFSDGCEYTWLQGSSPSIGL